MRNDFLTDEQVEQEIARLLESKEVKLAKKELQMKYKRRQYLYKLRGFEKRGIELQEAGITLDNIDEMMAAAESEKESED